MSDDSGKMYLDGVLVDATAGLAAPMALPPPVPAEVTNWQARAVLRKTFLPDMPDVSLFTRTDTMLHQARYQAQGLPETDPRRIEADINWQAWEQSNVFTRAGALLSGVGARFGLTDAQVDDLFRAAAAETV